MVLGFQLMLEFYVDVAFVHSYEKDEDAHR